MVILIISLAMQNNPMVFSVVASCVEDPYDEILCFPKMLILMMIRRMDMMGMMMFLMMMKLMMMMTMTMSAVLIPCCATQWCIVKTTQRLDSFFFSKTLKNIRC